MLHTFVRRGVRALPIGLAAFLLISLLAPLPAALATINPSATATDIAKAITVGEPNVGSGFVTGASFLAKPPNGNPDATSDTALPATAPTFPSNGANYGILTTGDATLAATANTSTSSGAADGGAPVRGTTDFDVTILKIDMNVPAGANCLSLDFQFFSEEFPEYKGSQFNDAFIAELGTSNWSTTNSSISAPNNFAFDQDHNVISINSLGETRVTAANAAGTTYDGGTAPLVATTPITTTGLQSLYLSIFDQGDQIFDSAAFVDNLAVGTALSGGCTAGARREISNAALTTVGADLSGTLTTPTTITSAPLSQVRLNALSQFVPAQNTPFGKTPFGKTPFGKTPFGKTPFGKTPFGKTPFGKTPFGKTPFGKTPFGKTQISEVGLLRDGGWPQVLADSCDYQAYTPQQVTLDQLFADSCAKDTDPSTFPEMSPDSTDPITLDQLIINGTPLAEAPALAVLMGAVPWDDVARPNGSWSTELGNITGCSGVNTADWIIASTDTCDLSLTTLPLRHVGDVSNPSNMLLWNTDVTSANIDGSAIGDIHVSSLPSAVQSTYINCAAAGLNCATATLRVVNDNGTNGAWKLDGNGEGIRFSDLGTALNGLTLSDIVIAFTDPSGYPYEDVPLAGMGFDRLGTPPTNFITYRLTFGVRCGDAGGLNAFVDLPDTFEYVGGSTQISDAGNASLSTADPQPAIEGPGFYWPISTSCAGKIGTDNVTIVFKALPGFTTGTFTTTASIGTDTVPTVNVNNAAPVHVVGLSEPVGADNASNATLVQKNSITVGQLETASDADYFKFTVPAGDQLTVSLSHLSYNGNLVLYAPPGSADAQSLRPNTSPIPVPVGTQPLPDAGALGTSSLLPPALQDIHIETGTSVGPVAGISDFTGNDPEFVTTTAVSGAAGSTTYTVQVSTGNGAHGPDPYVLIVRDATVQQPENCLPQSFSPGSSSGPKVANSSGASVASVSSSIRSLFLIDQSRLDAAYGAGSGASVLGAITGLMNANGGSGAGGISSSNSLIVNLDAVGAVNTAFTAWDAAPCSPQKMNDVVVAINNVIDGLKDSNANNNLANLSNIVVVGDGSIIPHAALPDGTFDGNENGFVGDTIFGGKANAMTGAFANSFFLSDAPYASLVPLSVAGQNVYVPQVALGRLGGDAATMAAQVTQFQTANGIADARANTSDPRTAVEADYSFLSDMGAAETASLRSIQGAANVHQLTGSTWTRTDLKNEIDGTTFSGRVPDVVIPNAHFDQSRLLPSAPNTAGAYQPSDLYTSADLPSSLALRVFATIGCHALLDFPDAIGGTGTPSAFDQARLADWEQSLQANGTAVAVGNLGYGLGDTATIALGERIMADFTSGLVGSQTVGKSMLAAQQHYFSSSASFTPYDLKALQEVTTWGMPMYKPPGNAAAPSLGGNDGTVSGTTVSFTSLPTAHTSPDGRTYFSGPNGQVQVTHPYPIMPKVTQDLTPPSGQVAHGALPISWNLSTQSVTNYAFANATYDNAAEGAPTDRTAFPTTFGQIGTTYDASGAAHPQLVVIPGQFRSNATGDPADGTFRKLTGDWQVFYSTDTSDFTGPEFQRVIVTDNQNGTSLLSVTVPGAIRVVAQVIQGGNYVKEELTQSADPDKWTKPLSYVPSEATFFAVDNKGNVSTANNGGRGYLAQPLQPGSVTVQLSGTSVGGFYTTPVTVTSDPSGYPVSIDAPAAGTGQSATTGAGVEGTHTGYAFALNNTTQLDSRSFTIDLSPPTAPGIQVPAPPAVPPGGTSAKIPLYMQGQIVYSRFTCDDATAGISSCLGKSDNDTGAGQPSGVRVNTSQLGIHTFTVTAIDNAGHTTTATRQYEVVKFTGFLSPIDNPPTQNTAKAGAGIPVKWILMRSSDGTPTGTLVPVADTYSFVSVTSVNTSGAACKGSPDAIEVYTGGSGLQYLGSGNWQFNWSTLSSYKGKCELMSLNLWDATKAGRSAATADFLFK